jgi:HPt (histidine-containing phosphotransfer) domain-containing protein
MKQRFLAEGFSGCLTKPVMWRDLEQRLYEWLPAELVTGGKLEEPDSLPKNPPDLPPEGKADRYDRAEKMKDPLAKDLSAWGVLLDEGLRYLEPETGLSQYKRLAEFFTENFKTARKEVIAMADQKNWKALRFSVHSLKSKAKAMGAADLYATAVSMEKYCMAGDGTYIETAMPLFLLEWERASRGLEEFTARMNELTGEAKAELRQERGENTGISRDEDMETLLRYIRGNRWSEATETLNRLLVTAAEEAEERKLKAVQEKISNLEFEQAEKLLLGE